MKSDCQLNRKFLSRPVNVTLFLYSIVLLVTRLTLSDENNNETCNIEYYSSKTVPHVQVDLSICDYVSSPIEVYSIGISTDVADQYKQVGVLFCPIGGLSKKFHVKDDLTNSSYKLMLKDHLDLDAFDLEVHAIWYPLNPTERCPSYAPNNEDCHDLVWKMTFRLLIHDCENMSWQTLTVIVLSVSAVVLLLVLIVMFILYKMKSPNHKRYDDYEDNYVN